MKSKPTNAPSRRVVPPPSGVTSSSSSLSLTSSSSPPPPPTPAPPPSFRTFQALALFDNDAEDVDELSFKKGDIVTVLGKEDGGEWWEAQNEKYKKGVVPANFFKVLQK